MKQRSPLLSIFLIVLVDILGYTILIPLLPFYAERYGATPFQIGLLLASYGICQMIAGPILGSLSDRFGRKPVLLASQCGTFVGFLILAFAPNLAWVFASRIIDGLTAGNLSVAQAYISDVTEAKDRAKSFAIIGISFGLGFLVGPAITGFLSHWSYHYPIMAAAGLSLTSILATQFLLTSTGHEPKDIQKKSWSFSAKTYFESFQDANVAPYLLQFFAFIFSFSLFIAGFALFAERRFVYGGLPFGAREVGYVFAYVGLLGILIQGGLIGRLVKRFGEQMLVSAGFIFMTSGFLLLSAAHSVSWMVAAVTLSFMGSSILRPSVTSLITQATSKEKQGHALGMTQSIMSLTQVLAPLISGSLIQHRLLSLWAWIGAIVSGAGLVWIHKGPSGGANEKQ